MIVEINALGIRVVTYKPNYFNFFENYIQLHFIL